MSEAICCSGCVVLVALAIVLWAVLFDDSPDASDGGYASSGSSDDDWGVVTAEDVALDPESFLPLPDGSAASQANCVALATTWLSTWPRRSSSVAADATAEPDSAWCRDSWLPAAALCAQHAVAFADAGSPRMTERCIAAAGGESHDETVLASVMSRW